MNMLFVSAIVSAITAYIVSKVSAHIYLKTIEQFSNDILDMTAKAWLELYRDVRNSGYADGYKTNAERR